MLAFATKFSQGAALPFSEMSNGYSVDCLAFSDGQFLAAGGQNGQSKIWQAQADLPELIAIIRLPGLIAWRGVRLSIYWHLAWENMCRSGMRL